MKILISNWRDIKHPRAGGAEMRLHKIYAPLTEAGHEVILYSCAFKGCEREEIVDGIKIYRLGSDLTFAPLCTLNRFPSTPPGRCGPRFSSRVSALGLR